MMGKICESGLKEITVPCSLVRSSFASFPRGIPLEYSWEYFQPSLSDLCPEVLRKAVYHRAPHTMKPAGYFVGATAELAPGVQGGHDGFQGSLSGRGMYVHRDTPPIVGNRDQPIGIQRDRNRGTKPGHRLIHGVVQNFIDQMMQAALIGTADVHPGPDANCFQSFQDLDIFRGIFEGSLFLYSHPSSQKIR